MTHTHASNTKQQNWRWLQDLLRCVARFAEEVHAPAVAQQLCGEVGHLRRLHRLPGSGCGANFVCWPILVMAPFILSTSFHNPSGKKGKDMVVQPNFCWSGQKREQQRGATRERARFVQLLPPTKRGAPLTAGLLCHLSLQREQAFAPARSGFRGRWTFFGFHLVKTPRKKIQIFPVVTNSL